MRGLRFAAGAALLAASLIACDSGGSVNGTTAVAETFTISETVTVLRESGIDVFPVPYPYAPF